MLRNAEIKLLQMCKRRRVEKDKLGNLKSQDCKKIYLLPYLDHMI